MPSTDQANLDRLLVRELRWLTRLRWLAGGATVAVTLADMLWLDWFAPAAPLLVVGLVILLFNVVAVWLMREHRRWRITPAWLAVNQIFTDLVCLTAMVMYTGGAASPLLGAFVFHMVFASLLLARPVAYGAAAASIVAVSALLVVTGQWPETFASRSVLAAWALVLLLTVYLSNHTTSALHRQRRRLMRQNRRVRDMSDQLNRQRAALVQHEKMAAMGQMAAGVAHEISNPLTNIDMMLQLALRHPERMDADKVSELRDQADRIRRIIRSMTDFAHPTETHWQPTRANQLVADAIQMLRFDRRLRGVGIEHEPSSGTCAVRVQPHAMQQVLINLLLNAADAVADVPDPSIRVVCRCDETHCMIDVIDNGHGIDPEALRHVFEPFYTTKPVGKGTGLGLSVSYSIVENQGGQIHIDSAPGAGTTVTVKLRRVQAEST